MPAEKVETIHYGLDDLPDAWGVESALDVGSGRRASLLAVSRLEPQKGIDVAIRALPRVRPGDRQCSSCSARGRTASALEALARELGVEPRVSCSGACPDVAAWLRRADVLVHPARWEGFGLAVLEAMLAGAAGRRDERQLAARARRRRRDGLARRAGRCARARCCGEPRARRSGATTGRGGRTRALAEFSRRPDGRPDARRLRRRARTRRASRHQGVSGSGG